MPTPPTPVYLIGSRVRIDARFFDFVTDAPKDPTEATIKLRSPYAVETEYVYGTDDEFVRDDVGVYHLDLDPDAVGTWFYRILGTGTNVQSAEERPFIIRASAFKEP